MKKQEKVFGPQFLQSKYGGNRKMKMVDYSKEVDETLETSYELDKEGYAVQVRKVVKKPASERYSGLKAADFSLQNLIAVGAVGNLKPVQYIGDVDMSLGNIDSLMDHIELLDNESPNVNVPKVPESVSTNVTPEVTE